MKPLRFIATVLFFLGLASFSDHVVLPAFAQSFNVSSEGVTVTAFGQHFNNHQTITMFAVAIALFCSVFLFKRVVMRECDCFCGPGKCVCGCGCHERCPCFFRDKSAHNDHARHTHHDYY